MGQLSHTRRTPEAREAVIRMYHDGYNEAEILGLRERFTEIDLNQSSLNRWVKKAREDDPDLEIRHLLNRRRRRPGVYTQWQAGGVIYLAPYYDPLLDTLFLGTGQDFLSTGGREPGNTVRVKSPPLPSVVSGSDGGTERTTRRKKRPKVRESDAAGPFVARLSSLGYSQRDIVALWKRRPTKNPELDGTPWVRWQVAQLHRIRMPEKAMSASTIGRILQIFSFGSVADS